METSSNEILDAITSALKDQVFVIERTRPTVSVAAVAGGMIFGVVAGIVGTILVQEVKKDFDKAKEAKAETLTVPQSA